MSLVLGSKENKKFEGQQCPLCGKVFQNWKRILKTSKADIEYKTLKSGLELPENYPHVICDDCYFAGLQLRKIERIKPIKY